MKKELWNGIFGFYFYFYSSIKISENYTNVMIKDLCKKKFKEKDEFRERIMRRVFWVFSKI